MGAISTLTNKEILFYQQSHTALASFTVIICPAVEGCEMGVLLRDGCPVLGWHGAVLGPEGREYLIRPNK